MDALREHLIKSLKGGQAFVSYKKGLNDIKPELRGVRPNKYIHSIYEELEHMRLAQKDLLDFALETVYQPPNWPEGFWPDPNQSPTEKDWNKTIKGFLKDQNRAINLAKNAEINLLSMVPKTEYTYLRELMIIIEHNSYHYGKILDIRKSLDNWK